MVTCLLDNSCVFMDIPVFGMTCAKCEAKVQAAVVSVVGVSDVRVNRLENLVQCAADSTLRANIEKSILDAGYSVEKLSQNDDGDEGERETACLTHRSKTLNR